MSKGLWTAGVINNDVGVRWLQNRLDITKFYVFIDAFNLNNIIMEWKLSNKH